MKTTIGGDRLGSGNKQEVQMRTYSRSTHDLGYLWRSTMSAGTLVPFMSEVGLPGDSFDIDLNCEVMTLPTTGPLFGSFKIQLDVFECPIRLYNGKLHMNMLNIGLDMSQIMLPQIYMEAIGQPIIKDDNEQINASSIYSYLNMRGLARSYDANEKVVREFNAVPYLAYWEIYKQYYANKSEERGFVIHNDLANNLTVTSAKIKNGNTETEVFLNTVNITYATTTELIITWEIEEKGEPIPSDIVIGIDNSYVDCYQGVWNEYEIIGNTIRFYDYTGSIGTYSTLFNALTLYATPDYRGIPKLIEFPLGNIDNMKMDILADVKSTTPFMIDNTTYAPYGLGLYSDANDNYSKQSNQEGLGIKTYQSDLFNNWISTEWIDGTNGINEVTSVSTVGDEFTIDALNLASKVYAMLNRIAISGGSYDDWLDAVYSHERAKSAENPIYHGSLIKELGFEEVISNSETKIGDERQALGTLGGRGRLTDKNKGGKIRIKISEPSYVIGIVSLTPRVDYSQGNKWDVNLKTLNDLHKPALDAIGYQDLITDQMAWFDTKQDGINAELEFRSAGKQPAWINYMTNVNQVRGNFAEIDNSMFMTLNRRYESGEDGIEDLTTYIDPSKYNQIFAETSLDSQNFWVQISVDNSARRLMSAKVIPNL